MTPHSRGADSPEFCTCRAEARRAKAERALLNCRGRRECRAPAAPAASWAEKGRRPLVIESIIALTRTAGSYARAVELFEEGAGEDVRRYVFQREWNSLSPTNHGRYVLAVLALNNEPMAFSDLVALTRYEESRVRDALADVREMFLLVNEIGEEATYQLGEMTRSFVLEQSKLLDQYAAIKERVAKYRSSFFPDNPILSRLRERVETLVYRGKFSDKDALRKALELISDKSLSPKITEDPRFNCLQAYVYSIHRPWPCDAPVRVVAAGTGLRRMRFCDVWAQGFTNLSASRLKPA